MSRITRVAIVFITLFLVSLLGAASLQARPLAQLPRPPRESEPLPYPQSSPDAIHQLAEPTNPSTITGYGAWSKIVFQSYRDSNWEIYIANGDGTGQNRLTANTTSDTYPRLNRGGTRIVFDSNRTGTYQIYTMNPDGAGLSQITSSAGNNYDPAWSPDGTKIAFESFRDGQAEIYVMNANGTGLIRLTNNPAFDGHPTWSPDGTKIAFTSDRGTPANTGNRVWVMNADGSSPQQLTTQYYGQNPNWSPDGTRIAFDADATNDGSQEIWLMNADGSGQIQVYDPPDESPLGYPGVTDAWVRSWSPDGNFIAFTRLTWIYYQGSWYWYTGYLQSIGTESGASASQLVPTQGDDWYPDWQTSDIQPPVVNLSGLPAFSRCWDASVTWSGTDWSGIASYDIQTRINGGVWTNWLTHTQVTAGNFSGPCGSSASFRARAQDNAMNRSTWTAPLTTTLYSYQINDLITDNRGFPLPLASLTISPAAVAPAISYLNGHYAAYLQLTGTHAVSVVQTGYGQAAPKFFDANSDLSFKQALPPADDVVQNGSFENGTTGWLATGPITPTAISPAAYAGQTGLFIGQTPGDLPAANLLREGIWGNSIQAAYDLSDTLHLLWLGNNGQLVYTSCGINSCQAEQSVPNIAGSTWPSIAVGPDGTVHAIWKTGADTIMYAARSPSGLWSTPEQVIQVTGYLGGPFGLAIDGTNHPHVAYGSDFDYYTHRQDGGTWTAPEQVGTSNGVPSLAFSSNGDLHMVVGGVPGSPAYYIHHPVTDTWGTPHAVGGTDAYFAQAAVAVDDSDAVHIVWGITILPPQQQFSYATRAANGIWSSNEEVPGASGTDPKVVARQDGTVVFAWSGKYVAYRTLARTWSTPRVATGTDVAGTGTSLSVSPNSTEVALASRLNTGLYAGRVNLHTESAGHSLMSQVVNLPADFHQPALSLFYKYTSENTVQNDQLLIHLSDGITTTTFNLMPSDWEHAWFGLDDWLGKTITVTVDLSTTANGYFTQAFLDEISIGSWLSPAPVAVQPQQVRAGQSAVITITGLNFIGTTPGEPYPIRLNDAQLLDAHWIDSTTLTATAPHSMPFGATDVFVTNPGGQTGALSDGLLIGERVCLPLVFK